MALLALVACALALPTPARADNGDFAITDNVAVTGMAADAGRSAYWVSDEAGGVVRAVSATGETLGKVTYQASTQSVQALSYARNALYIGDIGGNRAKVKVVQLSSLRYGAAQSQSWTLTYPDGSHTARALMVSPKGNIYIVTDGARPSVYRSPAQLSTTGANQLIRVGDAPVGVTDGVFLPNGSSIALRTNEQIVVIDAYQWTTTASSYVAPQPAGQAIALGLDGRSLLMSDGAKVSSVAIPTAINNARPTPTASASSSSAPSADASASPSPDAATTPTSPTETSAQPSLRGTFIALAAAVALSLVAALVVVLRK